MATKQENERMAVVETKVKEVADDVSELKLDVKAGFASIESKFENLDKQYASKWVQNAVAFVIGLIVAAVLGSLIALVVIKPNSTTTTSTGTTSTSSSPVTKSTDTTTNKTTSTSTDTSNTSDTKADSTSGGVHVELPKLFQ